MIGGHTAGDVVFPADAVWIGSEHPFDLQEVYLRFRSPADWQLAQAPKAAELLITADSRYKLWINGRFVSRGPARCWPHAQAVDRIDVTPYLAAGRNTLAVQVYQPGYSHFAYVHRGAAGLLAALTVDGEVVLTSGPAWSTRRDPSFSPFVPRVSIYQAGVEERDLRLVEAWTDPDFDAAAWFPARVVTYAGGHPWLRTRVRAVPLLVERELLVQALGSRQGVYPLHLQADPHLALRESWRGAGRAALAPDEDGWYAPRLAAGETALWAFDLGRGYTCQGWFDVRGAGGEEQAAVSYTEKVKGDEPYLSDPATYCRVRMTDRFRLRAGDQMGEPFAMRGGRLLLFQVVGPAGPHFRIRLHATVSEYPLAITHRLEEVDPLMAQIVKLCETTLIACLSDGFVDNPWREHAQWVGDPLIDSLVLAAMSDDLRPMRRVIELAAEGAFADGTLPSVLPSEALAYVVVDFNYQWVELLYHYTQLSADRAFLAEMWPALTAMIARFRQDGGEDGLLITPAGRRLFVDWSTMSKAEPNAIYNLHFVLALQLAASLAAQSGHAAEAAEWTAVAAALRQAAREAFWRDGCWYDDREGATYSQLAAALAVLTGAAEPAEAPALLDAVVARSLDLDDGHMAGKMVIASPYMHHRVLEALRQHRRYDEAIAIIRARWGRWVEGGHPTAWENWNVDFPDGSECHGFSSHPRYHLAEIAKALDVQRARTGS